MKIERFENILSDKTSLYSKVPKESYLKQGEFAIIDQGKEFIGGYTNDKSLVKNIGEPVIIFGDHTRIFKYVDFPIAIGADGVKALHVRSQKIYPKYIYYYLLSVKIFNAGYSRHFKFLKDVKFPIPEKLEDQIRIATILSKVETLIKQRKESIVLLDEFLKSTFLKMFGDPVRNDKGWEMIRFKQIASIERKQIIPTNISNQDFYIGLEDIEKETGNIIKSSTDKAEELKSSKFKFTAKHILYAKLRPYLNKVALPNSNGICSTDIFPILPLENIAERYFVCYLMRTKYFVNEMTMKSAGANLPRANADSIENLKVYKPPIELQNQFAHIVAKTGILKKQCQQSLQELENLFASLSQKAFKGELDLSKVGVLYGMSYSDYCTDRPETLYKLVQLETIKLPLKATTHKLYGGGKEVISPRWLVNQIVEKYTGKYFSFEMLMNFLKRLKINDGVKYFSSEEIKANPKYDEAEDIKVFLESAIVNVEMDLKQKEKRNPWLRLNQHFYNANKENLSLELTKEDIALIKNRTAEERSGIYFKIVPNEIN